MDGDGNLYAGGDIEAIGGVEMNNVAKWDGAQWSSLGGSGCNSENICSVWALAADNKGRVYVGGWFLDYEGIEVNHIAMWENGALASVVRWRLSPGRFCSGLGRG